MWDDGARQATMKDGDFVRNARPGAHHAAVQASVRLPICVIVMHGALLAAPDGIPHMMPFAALALGTNLITVAAEVPKLNIEPSCKAAGIEGMALGRTTQSCINDENTAHDQLVKDWSTYSADDKSHCLSMVSTG